MTLKTYIPAPPLVDAVQLMWHWEGYHPPHPRERILPTGMMEITFSLGTAPFCITVDGTAQHFTEAIIVGPHTRPFIIETRAAMTLLSVWFKPGGIAPFFGVHGRELHNRHIALASLWGPEAGDLYEQLCTATTASGRFRLLEATLLRRLLRVIERHRAVRYALHIFRTVPQAQSIQAVTAEVALSPTRFIQVFREDVGLTPKQFCRVRRFQQALRIIAHDPQRPWVDVALACGYYDQAHFNSEFRHFAGITPSAYVPQSADHNTNLAVHDGVEHAGLS